MFRQHERTFVAYDQFGIIIIMMIMIMIMIIIIIIITLKVHVQFSEMTRLTEN